MTAATTRLSARRDRAGYRIGRLSPPFTHQGTRGNRAMRESGRRITLNGEDPPCGWLPGRAFKSSTEAAPLRVCGPS
jgi:hypothetical protein